MPHSSLSGNQSFLTNLKECVPPFVCAHKLTFHQNCCQSRVKDFDILALILKVYLVDDSFSSTLRFSKSYICQQFPCQSTNKLYRVVLLAGQVLQAC